MFRSAPGSVARPAPPTGCLPPLARLTTYSTGDIGQALTNLRHIYVSYPLPSLPTPASSLPEHVIHDTSVPDSGYASAEEDSDDEDNGNDDGMNDEEELFDIDILRSDVFERDFAIRWLTTFTARSDTWVYDAGVSEEEQDARARLVDDAASLLSSFAGEDDEQEALTRTFSWPVLDDKGMKSGSVEVELNDAPLLSDDHTSVGLQSWGSAILFAEQMCAEPATFGLLSNQSSGHVRVLELGAGTGLLSIVSAKLLSHSSSTAEVIATDYHPQVLENLQSNVDTNFTASSAVSVLPLDWQSPVYEEPLDKPFDVILAADVVYHPKHARWIKTCVENLLRRPVQSGSGKPCTGGVFWLIIPVRSTGRHEGMADTVEVVFPTEAAVKAAGGHGVQLAIQRKEGMGKHDGIGRADESSYKLFRIGWVVT